MEKKTKIIIISASAVVVVALVLYYFLFFSVTLKYNKEIKSGDNFFTENKYTEAKTSYQNALKLKAKEEYPKNQIGKIDSKLKNIQMQNEYKKLIGEADKLYQNSAFEQAKEKYVATSKLNSKEQYPKDKIAEIDKILAKIREKALLKSYEYHIIVGSFMVENNAIRYNEKLINQGEYSNIFLINDGRFRAVSYASYPSLKAAAVALNEVKTNVIDEAWILHRKQ